MANERLNIIIDAQFKGKSEIQGVNRELKGLDDNARKSGGGLLNMSSKATAAFGGIAAGLFGVKQVWDTTFAAIQEGAALQKAANQFENLAESIGSSSDSMMAKLRTASAGMMSDAELIASAGQIISLGLADGEDGVARLAAVVGTLGLDMQQVILTFANNSTMRLDALGLSVEGVTAKAKELERNGFVGDAFDEAVLISLEEKTKLLGSTAGTSAGEIDKLQTALANVADPAKVALAERWTGVFFATRVSIELATDAAKDFIRTIEGTPAADVSTPKTQAALMNVLTGSYTTVATAIDLAAFSQEEYTDAADMYAKRGEDAANVTDLQARRFAYFNEQALLARDGQEEIADAADMYANAGRDAADVTDNQANRYAYFNEQAAIAAERLLVLEQAEAGYYTAALTATDQTFDMNQEIYNSAVQAGASAEELALLGGALGLFSEEAIDAALKAAAIRTKIQELAEAYAAGDISIMNMRIQLQQFITDLDRVPSEKTVSFKLDIPPIPAELQGGGVKMGAQGPQIYGANGLDFTVPPGFPNDSFGPIYVQSGEHVKVTPTGEVGKGGGGATINIYAYPGQSPQAIASAVNQQLAVGG
jgi:hypothetical protein